MARRVLIVENAPTVGGSVVSLYQLLQGLNRDRFEPVVALAEGNPYEERFRQLGVEVIPRALGHRRAATRATLGSVKHSEAVQGLRGSDWGRKVYHGVGFAVKHVPAILREADAFAGLVRRVRPDFVHTNDMVPQNRAEIMGSVWAGAPVLCHVRSFEGLNWLDRRLTGGIERYIFISRAIADWFLGLKVKARATDIVYNGVNTTEFRPMPDAREGVRRELGLPRDAQVAAIVGRLVPWKGQEIFVDALERLAGEYSRLWGLVVGSGLDGGTEFERRLRAKVDAGPMKGRIVFAGHCSDVNRVLAGADVLVHASIEPEPFGRVVVEGMAAGVPVVASAEGAVPEIIEDGKTGLLFPPGDHAGLAQALERVIATPDLSQRLARNGRREVETRFRSELYVAGVEAVYEVMV